MVKSDEFSNDRYVVSVPVTFFCFLVFFSYFLPLRGGKRWRRKRGRSDDGLDSGDYLDKASSLEKNLIVFSFHSVTLA